MSTIDSWASIETMLENNGAYPGDPQAYSIWEYMNDWGKKVWKVCEHPSQEAEMHASPFVHNPRKIWDRVQGRIVDPDSTKQQILKSVGLTKEVNRVKQGLCPTCKQPVKPEDFKDDLSRREFSISGMCQKCQDKVFG